MEKPTLATKKRRLKHALTTLALFTALAAIPAYIQTSSGETSSQPPIPPLWSILEDADQDGMTDVDELLWGMDPFNPEDGLSDLDGDDISLAWEFAIGTNPDMADTDMDGWSDSEEFLLYGTDPLDALSFPLGDTPTSGGSTGMETTPVPEAAPPPPPSLSNGNFSDVGITTWKSMLFSKDYQGKGFVWNAGTVGSWIAYAGTTVEVWDAGGEKFVELDGSPESYGIKQPIANAKAGGYVLVWRESGRKSDKAGDDPYAVRVYYKNETGEVVIGQSEFTKLDKSQWKDNTFAFQITPEQLAAAGKNPIYVAYIPTGSSLNTYGTLIDKVNLLPVEVVELSPNVKDETGTEIANSNIPVALPKANGMVEEDPANNRIAHRELRVRIGSALKDKKVTWSMEAKFTPTGANQPHFRGDWASATEAHRNRFEASTAYGANAYRSLPPAQGETKVDTNGFTAIRVNVPPWGLNKARIKIQIEGTITSIDLIDLEVPGVIVIDPGHGTGAAGSSNAIGGVGVTTGVEENAIALDIGMRMVDDLRRRRNADHLPIKVFMTRTSAVNKNFIERTRVARENGCDIYISIHFNSVDSVPLRRHPFGMWDLTGNHNLAEDQALASRVRQAVQRAILAIEPAESRDTPTDGITSETHEANLQKGLDTLSDSTSTTTPNMNGNIPGHTPCRAMLIELEWLSNTKADQLFSDGKPTLSDTADRMREEAGQAMAGAAIEDLYAAPIQ